MVIMSHKLRSFTFCLLMLAEAMGARELFIESEIDTLLFWGSGSPTHVLRTLQYIGIGTSHD
jgi:hypothetical protein